MNEIWNIIQTSLKKRIANHSFEMWIEPLRFVECKNNILTLACTNSFSKKIVGGRFGHIITEEAGKILQSDIELAIDVVKQNNNRSTPYIAKKQKFLPDLYNRLYGGRPLRKNFTFDKFVVGKNNDFAYSASLSMASEDNNTQHALLLFSKTGMGKSHLSQAIGHHILKQYKNRSVCYVTAEDFTNEMVCAFQNNSMEKFKDRYRKQCDVLLIEDIDFFSGKKRSQQELALTLDSLFDSGKKIIFTSRYLPNEIPKLHEGLTSRISSGIVSAISNPDFATRLRILKKKIKFNDYASMPDEVLSYLAGELTENVRQLESGLSGVAAKASLLGLPVDKQLAASVVRNIANRKNEITIDYIKEMVCKHYGIRLEEIVSRSRKQTIVRPRQMAMYLSRRYTDQPLTAIGKNFNRYHATVLHSIHEIEKRLKSDSALSSQVEFFQKKFDGNDF